MYAASVAEPTRPLLVMTRVVDAPRAAVFERWLRPEQQARWWDTSAAAAPPLVVVPTLDGGFRVRRRDRRGRATTVAILEARRAERIEFTWGGDDVATATLITVGFSDHGTQTRLTLRQRVLERGARCGGLAASTAGYLDRLAELLQAMPRVCPA